MSGSAWRHECVVCGSVFFDTRCRIACMGCHAQGFDKACGECIVCGTKVRFFPRRRNKGPLFCRSCRDERHLESVKRTKRLHRVGYAGVMPEKPLHDSIVVTPTEEVELL